MRLTPEGEQLQRQAHLLMRQVKAFEAFARAVPDSATQDIALVYDPFTPEPFAGADRYAGDEKDPPEPDQRIAR